MKRKKQNIILLKLGFAENENVIFRKQWGILNESSWCQGLNVLYSKVMRESDKEKSYGLVFEYHIFFFSFQLYTVNFTNIVRADFLLISFYEKIQSQSYKTFAYKLIILA